MFNVCDQCGIYRDDKDVSVERSVAVCPECGHAHTFKLQPLFVLSGASGSGKTTAARRLTGILTNCVVLDSDILWGPEFEQPEQWPRFFNLWLRMAKNIGQAGKPVLLCGAGVGVPDNLANCVEARYFRDIHYLALVCDDDVLAERLHARPVWRNCSDQVFIDKQIAFNRWFIAQGSAEDSPINITDTTRICEELTTQAIIDWIYTCQAVGNEA